MLDKLPRKEYKRISDMEPENPNAPDAYTKMYEEIIREMEKKQNRREK